MDFRTWVNDRALAILGISEPAITEFIIATASSSSSPSSLYTKLSTVADLPQTEQVKEFVQELFKKAPRKKTSSAKDDALDRKMMEKEQIQLLERNKKYTLLDEEEDVEMKSKEVIHIQKGKHSKKRYKRVKDEKEWDEDEEDEIQNQREKEEQEEQEAKDEQEELSREQDLKERDEFASRLKERDKSKTKVSTFHKD